MLETANLDLICMCADAIELLSGNKVTESGILIVTVLCVYKTRHLTNFSDKHSFFQNPQHFACVLRAVVCFVFVLRLI